MRKLGKDFDFVGKRTIFIIVSLLIMAVGLLFNIFVGLELHISFKGGTAARYSFEGSIDSGEVKNFLQDKMGMTPDVDMATADNAFLISFASEMDMEQTALLDQSLKENFPENNLVQQQLNTLKPSMGTLFFIKCMVAIVLSSLFLMIYVAIRFRKIGGISAGAMALLALFHDIVIAYFAFVVLRIPLNDSFVAVVLTILGYSLNDTIIIYDRIRENRRLMHNAPIGEIVNKSINQSFTRSFNTALSTFIAISTVAVLALINGLDDIVAFAVPMMVGIIAGSYSSIFVCCPLWVVFVERKEKKKKSW